MKKHIAFTLGIFCLLLGCNNGLSVTSISTDSKALEQGEVLFSKNNNSYLYDIQITDSYFVLLDSKSDTVLQVYPKQKEYDLYKYGCRENSKDQLYNPYFTNSDSRNKKEVDQFSVVDNNLYIKLISLSGENGEISVRTASSPLSNIHSANYNLTDKEIYATPIHNNKQYPFYYYNLDSGYFWVDAAPSITKEIPAIPTALVCNLCINENNQSIVSAYRFTNQVQFCNLKGDLKGICKLGNDTQLPICLDNEKLDIVNSTKCFTDIYGTAEYVYCLYDGSTDFSAPSKILVFTWNGKHVETWQADRNLRAIAIDKNDTYILAIAANGQGEQNILRYALSDL